MINEEKMFQMITEIHSDMSVLKHDVSELKHDVSELKHDVSELKHDVSVLKQRVTKIEVIIENELNPKISIIAEGHLQLDKKLVKVDELDEKVLDLEADSSIHNIAIKELFKRKAE